MSSLESTTTVEKISGHLFTETVLTYVSALSGNPLAALLPILTNSLASERQKNRIETALTEIDATLHKHSEKLRNLDDAQYKLINEAILALLQTTSHNKIEYLRRAVSNTLANTGILPQEAVVLSRIVRDISAEEADFLLRNFHYDKILVAESARESEPDQAVLVVAPSSHEGLVVTGLVSLGLLTVGNTTWGRVLVFTPIVAKLLTLLSEPSQKSNFTY